MLGAEYVDCEASLRLHQPEHVVVLRELRHDLDPYDIALRLHSQLGLRPHDLDAPGGIVGPEHQGMPDQPFERLVEIEEVLQRTSAVRRAFGLDRVADADIALRQDQVTLRAVQPL